MLSQDEINALLAQSIGGGDDSGLGALIGGGSPEPTPAPVSAPAPQPAQAAAAAPAVSLTYTPTPVSVQMPAKGDLGFIGDIPLKLSVYLGKTQMPIKEALKLSKGALVELNKMKGDYADIYVNNQLFARGEIVIVDEHFGICIKKIINIEEREQLLKRI